MIVNKQILEAHEVIACEGYAYCRNVVGNGTDEFVIGYDEAVNAIRNDTELSREHKAMFLNIAREMKNSPLFYEMQNKGTLMQKYHVFNPVTGQYEYSDSLDAAKVLQEKIKTEFLQHHSSLFDIQQEFFIAEENKSLWKTVDVSAQI